MTKTTLVIHPYDLSTNCLSVIYADRDWTVINDLSTSLEEITEQIKQHDRIVMLGHGSPDGLLAGSVEKLLNGQKVFRKFARFVINRMHAPLLKEKETISIWCNSDAFFSRYDAGHGLHTGMIISEVGEEWVCLGHAPLNEEQMANNMKLFCGAFAKYIDLAPEEMRRKVLEEYVGDDEVTGFNRDRITVL